MQSTPQHNATPNPALGEEDDVDEAPTTQKRSSVALELGIDLQQVSRKGQLRLAVDLKRTLCKSCNTILIPGRTATHVIENSSKDDRKPWADVLVVTCGVCGGKKRFPVGAAPRLSKTKRKNAPVVATPTTASEEGRRSDATPLTGTE